MRARLSILFAALCFGTTGTAATFGPKSASALSVGASRIFVGALLLQFVSLWYSRKKTSTATPVRRRAWLLAGIGMGAYQVTFFAGVRASGVTVGTVVALGSAPALTGLINWLWLKSRPTPLWWWASAFAIAGVITLTLVKQSANTANSNPWGIALALGAGASYAIFAVASKEILAGGMSLQSAMANVFTIGAIALTPLFILLPMGWVLSLRGILMVLWLGIVPTAIAYLAYAFGLQRIQPNEAATLTLAEPVTATLLGIFLLAEHSQIGTWCGIALVALGLALLTWKRSPHAASSRI